MKLSDRWHCQMHPKHRVWDKKKIVLATRRINRLFDGINWEEPQ